MAVETVQKSKRDEIVEVAGQLFYEQGYGATGVAQIIKACGIAKGTFYGHFKSKEELGVAWLQARHVTWSGWLEEILSKPGTSGEKLAGVFDFLGDWLEREQFRGCAFLNTLAETPEAGSPMREEVRRHKEGLRERLVGLAREHFAGLSAEEAEVRGTVIFLLFEGALVEAANFGELWPVEAARGQVEALLKGGLA
jgi:AcrR family transcriptional regulator